MKPLDDRRFSIRLKKPFSQMLYALDARNCFIYAPDDTVTAISIFEDYAGAQESNRRGLAWIEQNLAPLLTGPATAMAGPVIVHTLA